VVYGAAITAVAGLVLWQAGSLNLGLSVLGGIALTLAFLALGALLLVRLLRVGGTGLGTAWRYGLGNLGRYRGRTLAQITAFGTGLMVLLLLSVVRGDVLSMWRASVPADAPNQFLINIQPEEREGVADALDDIGIRDVVLHPLVRARLLTINGEAVEDISFDNPRADNFVQRDANLSWTAAPQPDNRIRAGQWWNEADHGRPLISVEEDLAERLGIAVGDRLGYRIGGEEIELQIANLRSVRWDSFNVNFFMVTPPGVLDELPATWVTSIHVPGDRRAALGQVVEAYPSVTIIDVERILTQVRDIMDRASLAVEYVFAFTLLAGIFVLLAAVQATRAARRFESALLRALGARRSTVTAGVLAEFGLAGGVAGLLAAAGAMGVGWLVADRVFELPWTPQAWILLLGMAGGALLLGLTGLAANRSVLRSSPLAVLRRAE
jgi:putative ABC transport system permease protein